MTEKPETNLEMTDYYAQRAGEYERIYQKPERQEDLKKLQGILKEACKGLDLLEIACGTGYWTQFAAQSASSILATDYNEEVLDVARRKNYGNCPVTFLRSDAYVLEEVSGIFTGALVGFWWSHVSLARLDEFLLGLHSKLGKGARVMMLDNLYVEGSSTPVNRKDEEGNTYQIRTLSDGTVHEVLKNFPTREEFLRSLASVSESSLESARFTQLDYFWLAEYIL